MTQERPLVTVVLPARNAGRTIKRALDSAVAQSYRPIEIVVALDSCDDNTERVVSDFDFADIRTVATEYPGGAARARNAAIAAARGELIAFLDADDEWLETKLELQVPLLLSNPRLSFVACASNEFSPDGRNLGDTCGGLVPVTGAQAWKALLAANYVATPTVVARRRTVLDVGGFDPLMKIGEDQDMWIKLALAGELGFVNESLVRVHVLERSLSNEDFSDQMNVTMPMIERHVTALAGKLSRREARAILGERWGRLGQWAYARGDLALGARMICRSMGLGYRPLENLSCLVRAAPPVQWLKRHIRKLLSR